MNAMDETAMRRISLKIRLLINTPWHILTKGSPAPFLTSLEIVAIDIVRPPRIRRVRAYGPEGSYTLCTWNVSIRLFDLALKWRLRTLTILMTICRRTYLVNMHMCAKFGTARFSRLFAVHNRATHRANYGVDLWSRPRSNLNPATESPHATFYLLGMTMFVLSVTVCEILTVELYTILTLNFRTGQGQM